MATCGSCGRNAERVVTTFAGAETVEKCNLCAAPGDVDFLGPSMVPSDKKMWPDWIVNPNRYKKVGDTLVATDECKADLQEEVMGSPEADRELEMVIKKKREFAAAKNLTPLTQAEIDARVEIFRTQHEDAQKLRRFQDAGLVLP